MTAEAERRPWRGRLVAVVALAVGLRLLVFAAGAHDPRKLHAPDSYGYEQLALNLLRHGVFSSQPAPPYTPDLLRTPVYPAVIAAVFGVVGPRPGAVAGLQILLGGATALATFWLGRRLGLSDRAATVAALVVAVDPVSVMTASLLLTETLFTALLVLGIGLLVRHWQTGRARPLAGAALAIGLAALTRPVLQLLPVFLLPLFALAGRGAPLRATVRAGILFVLLALALPGAWTYRNHREAGLAALTSAGEGVLYWYWARAVLAEAEGISQETALERLRGDARGATGDAVDAPAERVTLRRRQALAILARHPGLTLAMLARSAGRLFGDPGYTLTCTLLDPSSREVECFPGRATMNEPGLFDRALGRLLTMSRVQQLTLVGSGLLLGAVYLGAAFGGLAFAGERRWLALALLVVIVAYLTLFSLGAQADSRFRIPLLPFLAVLAGTGLERLARRLTRLTSRRLSAGGRAWASAAPPRPR
jgi:4-amino-4-deoxy-L-arabinose transferase-like glycosyltransferase